MRLRSRDLILHCAALILVFAAVAALPRGYRSGSCADWAAYNGGVDGDHYSPLAQINRTNVRRLRIAWRYDTGETGNIKTNPLIVGGRLFACTPGGNILGLDAATGERIWQFNPGVEDSRPSRRRSYWSDGRQARLYCATAGNRRYCVADR